MKSKCLLTGAFIGGFFCIFDALSKGHNGFLNPATLPDSLAILPPPPTEDSLSFLLDKARYEAGRTLRDGPHLEQAKSDADYNNFGIAFSEAFGLEISPTFTPVLYELLTRVLQDSHDFALHKAKDHYKRVRPFNYYKDNTCTPDKDKILSTTGSYPSGHASFGWAAALVLAEINPTRQNQILRRGYDFGTSRVLCGAHWQSDVDNGRIMGATIVAALHSNTDFLHMLDTAKNEFREFLASKQDQRVKMIQDVKG